MSLAHPFPPFRAGGRKAGRRSLVIETPPRLNFGARVLPVVAYDCGSIGCLVRALGGQDQLADYCGTTPEAVSEWVYRNSIPPGWHLRLLLQASARGKTVAPSVFGLECSAPEACTLAGLMVAMRPALEQGGPAHV